jgi:hypothetical protein
MAGDPQLIDLLDAGVDEDLTFVAVERLAIQDEASV